MIILLKIRKIIFFRLLQMCVCAIDCGEIDIRNGACSVNCWFMLRTDHRCEGGGEGKILESKHLDYMHSMGREL